MAMFIRVDIPEDVQAEEPLRKQLVEVCPVDIFALDGERVVTVEANLDECTLCDLCIEASNGRVARSSSCTRSNADGHDDVGASVPCDAPHHPSATLRRLQRQEFITVAERNDYRDADRERTDAIDHTSDASHTPDARAHRDNRRVSMALGRCLDGRAHHTVAPSTIVTIGIRDCRLARAAQQA